MNRAGSNLQPLLKALCAKLYRKLWASKALCGCWAVLLACSLNLVAASHEDAASTNRFAPLPPELEPISAPAANSEIGAAAAAATPAKSTESAEPVFTISMDSLDDKHKLAIGDRLSFRILEDREDPQEPLEPRPLVVTDSGELEIPYIGRFPAEGKTCKQLARELKTALEKEYYYQATVIIAVDLMARTRGKVYLVGPVRAPGPQEIPSDETLTLSKAIMRAGGFMDYADRRSVKITRKSTAGETEKTTLVVDVADILDKGKIERDVPLEPGDLILIPERLIRF